MDHDPEQYLPDFLALQRENLLAKHRSVTRTELVRTSCVNVI